MGFEPTTRGLKGRCSNQAELWAPKFCAILTLLHGRAMNPASTLDELLRC